MKVFYLIYSSFSFLSFLKDAVNFNLSLTIIDIASLSTSEIGAIDTVKSGINASKDDGVNAVDNAAKAIQNATKLGELF